MAKKDNDKLEDTPKDVEGTEKEAPKEPEKEVPKEPKEEPCKKRKPIEAPPHLPVGCTHD